ncbi:CD9 antigen-like isoform X2 [Mugil cephalus]|nr:CD9 antigen-like isoform X2 [Mugil cephalus]
MGFYTLRLGLLLRFSMNTIHLFREQGSSSNAFTRAVKVMIVLGLVLLVCAWTGKKGVYNGNKKALEWFAVFLTCLSTTAFAAGDFAYSQRDEVGKSLEEFYIIIYTVYAVSGDQAVGITLTFIQHLFHCCGITGVSLIELVKQTCPAPDGITEILYMPSCPKLIEQTFKTKSMASVVKAMFYQTGQYLVGALLCSIILISQLYHPGY